MDFSPVGGVLSVVVVGKRRWRDVWGLGPQEV
jgi:hypothetical protein